MLVRQRVGAGPTVVISPQSRPVNIQIWAMSAGLESPDDTSSRTYVSHTKEKCTVSEGIPLPIERPVMITLMEGQALWAMAPDDGFLGVSILGV